MERVQGDMDGGGGEREAQELAAVSSSQKREEVEWLYMKILINT